MAVPLPYNYPHYAHLELTNIPRLPIPPLDETLDKYLATVSNLLTPEEFEVTKANVEDFRKRDGPVLHQKLLELAKEVKTSWLEGLWDSLYLEPRDPNPINVTPFFAFEDDPKNLTQSGRAASLAFSSLKFYQKIKRKVLEPDMERNTPLCMNQYGRLFASTRIPLSKRDELRTWYDSRHISVAYRGQFFWFDVLDSEDNILAEAEIRRNFDNILEEGKTCQLAPPLGILTTEDRDNWARARSLLEADSVSARSLDILDRSLFMVCLDDASPENLQDLSPILLHSDGKNRWYDKSLQLIVCSNGKSAINMEHSGFDGHTILRYSSEVHADSIKPQKDGADQASKVLLHSTSRRFQWNFTAPLLEAIAAADAHFSKLVASTQSFVLSFQGYGKNWAVKHKLSPDALVQLCYQITYMKLYGKVWSVYESGLTKQFYHGRTECVRPVTSESLAFCRAFLGRGAGAANDEQKEALLRKAATQHVKVMTDCKNGRGIDRHLTGMAALAKHRVQLIHNFKMPAIYTDKAYSILKTDLMSTSNCGNQALNLFGFGPTAANGLGLGYIIKDESINVNVTSFIGEASRYGQALEQTFLQVKALVEANEKRRAAAPPSRAKL